MSTCEIIKIDTCTICDSEKKREKKGESVRQARE